MSGLFGQDPSVSQVQLNCDWTQQTNKVKAPTQDSKWSEDIMSSSGQRKSWKPKQRSEGKIAATQRESHVTSDLLRQLHVIAFFLTLSRPTSSKSPKSVQPAQPTGTKSKTSPFWFPFLHNFWETHAKRTEPSKRLSLIQWRFKM